MKKSTLSKRTPPSPKNIPTTARQLPEQQSKLTKSLQDSLISGFGIGIGNSIAHNLMNGLFSNIKTSPSSSTPQNDRHNCKHIMTELDTCLLLNKDCSDVYTKLNLHKCQYEEK